MGLNMKATSPTWLYVRWRHWTAFWLCILLSMHAAGRCIGVVTAGGGVDYWQHVEQGALAAGKDLDIQIIVRGAKKEKDARSQAQIIDQMADAGCTGLVIAPNSPERIAQVEALARRNITSVFIDRDLGGSRAAVIMTDNFAAGQLAAREMLLYLKPGSNIGILRLDPEVQSTSERERGFIQAIEAAGHRIVLDDYLGADDTLATQNAYQDLLGMRGVHGIFTPNESTTLSVLNMRQRVATARNIVHVGFDANPVFREHIAQGRLNAIVVQDPHRMGYEAVETVYKIMQKQHFAQRIHTPTRVINQLNLNASASP